MVATFDPKFDALAEAFIHIEHLLHTADSLLDGTMGYVCEVGDGHPYWRAESINDAAKLLDLPELQRLRESAPK